MAWVALLAADRRVAYPFRTLRFALFRYNYIPQSYRDNVDGNVQLDGQQLHIRRLTAAPDG
jgi:hypothetical protein